MIIPKNSTPNEMLSVNPDRNVTVASAEKEMRASGVESKPAAKINTEILLPLSTLQTATDGYRSNEVSFEIPLKGKTQGEKNKNFEKRLNGIKNTRGIEGLDFSGIINEDGKMKFSYHAPYGEMLCCLALSESEMDDAGPRGSERYRSNASYQSNLAQTLDCTERWRAATCNFHSGNPQPIMELPIKETKMNQAEFGNFFNSLMSAKGNVFVDDHDSNSALKCITENIQRLKAENCRTIFTEALSVEEQNDVNRYLAGEIDHVKFTRGARKLLKAAKEAGDVRVIGINSLRARNPPILYHSQ
jgi:hypothetical protein